MKKIFARKGKGFKYWTARFSGFYGKYEIEISNNGKKPQSKWICLKIIPVMITDWWISEVLMLLFD